MPAERITLHRTNIDKTESIEQYPKTIAAQVYDFDNSQFLDMTLNDVTQQLDQIDYEKQLFYFLKEFLLQSHRVSEHQHAENTIPALYKAKQLRYDAVEVDVRKTSDGVYILMHDETVDRTTNGTGKVSDLTWSEIQDLVVDEYYADKNNDEIIRVPSLDEFMKVASEIHIAVTLDMFKQEWTQAEIAEIYSIVMKYNMLPKTLWNTYHPQLDYIQAVDDRSIISVSVSRNMTAEEILARCAPYKYRFATSEFPLRKDVVDVLKKNGIPSFIFGINSDFLMIHEAYKNGNTLVETNLVLKEDFDV